MNREVAITARLRASALKREARFTATADEREALLKAAEKWIELAEGMERLVADDAGPTDPIAPKARRGDGS